MQLERLEPSPFSHTPIKRWMFHLLMLTKVALFAQLSVRRARTAAVLAILLFILILLLVLFLILIFLLLLLFFDPSTNDGRGEWPSSIPRILA